MIGDYRNVHAGRSAVLFLSGPTLAQYVEPEPDLVTVGVNTTIFYRQDLDYFFIQDVGRTSHSNSYVSRKVDYNAFRPRIAKFYGVTLCPMLRNVADTVPYQFTHGPIINIGGARIEDPKVAADFSADLANNPPAAAGSVAFPALQFLLWTGVKRIYIVGADITDGRRIGEAKATQNYVKQNHLQRWQEFEKWVAVAYPDVEFIPLNPVGLKGMFSLRNAKTAAIPAATKSVPQQARFRFHCLGIPHTVTSPAFAHCAYTQAVLRFCKFMTESGHEVYHYGHERSEVVCTEHVTVTNDEDIAAYADWKTKSFNGQFNDICNQKFTARAIPEITKRLQYRDFLLCWYGTGHRGVAGKVGNSMIVVEPAVYCFKSFAPFRVFGSYSLMHHIYGQDKLKPRVYDTVIPGFIDPSEFRYSTSREDWLLYLGRVEPLKGIQVAIDVAQRTGRRLKVAGQGELKEVPSHVEMVGYADAATKADLLSRAAALVQPSLYSEPFGYNIIEASMSGTPVITPDWGGFTETVVHGMTGWRCRSMSQYDWAVHHLDQIKPETCRQWALANYTVDQARARYEEYFKDVRGVFFGCDFYGRDPNRAGIVGPTRQLPVPQKHVETPPEKVELPSTTLLIPTYNRNELLEFGLQSVRAHKFPGRLEILVLDEGAEKMAKETEAVAKKWNAEYVRTRAAGDTSWRIPGFALNIGAKLAKGEILVLSCPEIFHRGPCLQELVEQVARNPNAIAIPRGLLDDGEALKALKDGRQPGYSGTELRTQLPFLLALRRDAYIAIGGYDEDFVGRCYDDDDFVDRLVAMGMEYVYTQSPIIHLYHSTDNRSTPEARTRALFNQQLWKARKGIVCRNVGREWGVSASLVQSRSSVAINDNGKGSGTEVSTNERAKYDDIYARNPKYGHDCFGAQVLPFIDALTDITSVLDVGTGCGDFASMMADRGKKVWAVDMCQAAIDVASKDTRLNCICATLPGLPIDATFDLVTAFDLLEHIPEELVESALLELAKRSRKHVVVSVAWTPSRVCGHDLHPCLKPQEWWLSRMNDIYESVEIIRHKPGAAGMFVHMTVDWSGQDEDRRCP